MRVAAVLALAPLAVAGLAGCFHREGCEIESIDSPIYVVHCPSYTYVKAETDEARLLADEKIVRGLEGVADVRTRLENGNATVTVTCHRDDDIAVRERLIALGYHRRW